MHAAQLTFVEAERWVEREVVVPRSGRPLELCYYLVQTEQQLAAMVACCKPAHDIAHDTEGSGLVPALGARVVGHSLACQTRGPSPSAPAQISMFYVPVRHVAVAEAQLEPERVAQAVGEILAAPGRACWAHAKYDWAMLRSEGLPLPQRAWNDVLVLANLYNENELDNRLKSLADKYAFEGARSEEQALEIVLRADARQLGMRYKQRVSDEDGEIGEPTYLERFGYSRAPIRLLGHYACRDVLYTLYLWLVHYAEVPQRYAQTYARDIGIQRELHEMEWAGLPIDEVLVRETHRRTGIDAEYWLKRVREIALDALGQDLPADFTATDDELRELLFDRLGLVPQKWLGNDDEPSRRASIDREARELLRYAYSKYAELIVALNKLADARKQHGTYGASFLRSYSAQTGCVYPSYNALEKKKKGVPRTGRLSSEKPNVQNVAGKKQTIGEDYGQPFLLDVQRYFIVPLDMVRLYVDFSQIELRMLTWFCQDPQLLSCYPPGGPDRDVHQLTSDLLSVERNPTSKQVNFLTIYGGTERALALKLGERYFKDPKGTREYAKTVIERFFVQYACIRAFEADFSRRARSREGYFVSPFGRPRRIPDLCAQERWRMAAAQRQMMSSIVSGTAADLMKECMLRNGHYLRGASPKSIQRQSIHDELVFDLDRSCWPELTQNIRYMMQDWPMFTSAGPDGLGRGVGISVSCKAVPPGGRWSDKKELKFDAQGRVLNPASIG